MKQITNNQLSKRVERCIVSLLLPLVLLTFSPMSAAEDVVAVVRKGTPVATPISRIALSSIFSMRLTTWPDGSAIRVFVLPDDNQLHSIFSKQILRLFPHQLRIAWDRLVYSGTGQAPVVLNSIDEMATRIANTPGAIGYLPKDTKDDNLAVLNVE
jgi:ABC-type phosphate transport system substrate-binding protein